MSSLRYEVMRKVFGRHQDQATMMWYVIESKEAYKIADEILTEVKKRLPKERSVLQGKLHPSPNDYSDGFNHALDEVRNLLEDKDD